MNNLLPKEIVEKLNLYIIGQHAAKKAVAVALRNRWRKKQISSDELRNEIVPHNIIMIGPTGVGKTEIARRLAKLSKSPFIKVEATKFTEIGYVGRDVDSIIRDLLDIAIKDVRKIMHEKVKIKAFRNAKNKIITQIVGKEANSITKDKYYRKLESGELNTTKIKIQVLEKQFKSTGINNLDNPSFSGNGQMGILNVSDILQKTLGDSKKKLVSMTINEAIKYLTEDELGKLIKEEEIIKNAKKLVEEDGIVFLDEIDKITAGGVQKRNEVNREGVQRDLLPLIEGTIVNTKYGNIKTNYILFIASGAFHTVKPSDLLPEFQGRLPVKVFLNSLNEKDLYRILVEKRNPLPMQYKSLLKVESLELKFNRCGLEEIVKYTIKINNEMEDIGARRLYGILEQIFEDLNFLSKKQLKTKIIINKEFVRKKLSKFLNYKISRDLIL